MEATMNKPYYNLMVIMKMKHVTQLELAKGIDMSYSTLNSKIVGKYSMKLEEAKRIAKYLHISLEDID